MSSSSGTSSSSSSDDYFLDMVRTQMREMNPRQKMRFQQKIFNALVDATDTPSGYENVSDVSIVSATKHTPEPTSTLATALTLPAVAKSGATAKAAKRQGSVAAESPAKRICRVMPMVKVPMIILRQNSSDSNSSDSNSSDSSSSDSSSSDSNSIDINSIDINSNASNSIDINSIDSISIDINSIDSISIDINSSDDDFFGSNSIDSIDSISDDDSFNMYLNLSSKNFHIP